MIRGAGVLPAIARAGGVPLTTDMWCSCMPTTDGAGGAQLTLMFGKVRVLLLMIRWSAANTDVWLWYTVLLTRVCGVGVLPAAGGAGGVLEPARCPHPLDRALPPLHPKPLLHPHPPSGQHVLTLGQRRHHLAVFASVTESLQVTICAAF